MGEKMLKTLKIKCSYENLPVLHDISIEINEGELVAVVGSNGAGKTTLLKAISGILPVDSGKIFFRGKDITNLAPDQRVRLGISLVPEGRRIFSSLKTIENLKAGAFLKRDNLNEKIRNVFKIFPELEERKEVIARNLSGGELQMLAIARSLMSSPSLLMVDEMSQGLAPKIVQRVYEIMETLKKEGNTILLVEQNIFYALKIADRGYVIENGKIVLQGEGRKLLKNKMVKRHYLGIAQ